MKVKICGISNEIDALAAIELGADAIGFVMGGKVLPVEVEPYAQHVRQIIKKFPAHVDSFLVTHLLNAKDVLELAAYIQSTGIQVSEDIAIDEMKKVRNGTTRKIIKTVVSDDPAAKEKLKQYEPYCDFILLDSRRGNEYTGGTGIENNWAACAKLIKIASRPVLIAGGLTCDNVASAIQTARPYGTDVSTGVSHYGDSYLKKDRKDTAKIKQFIKISKAPSNG